MKLLLGDCLDKLKELEDNSVDSIVTDPPYGLSAAKNSGKNSKGGFMGKQWDYDVPSQQIWEECMRVLKPGGHLLAFAGSRTYHRMAVRIEDAGFEIRDQIMWIYGSGFPKSHNIGKAVDKLEGNERQELGENPYNKLRGSGTSELGKLLNSMQGKSNITKGTSPYEGWGTALKPAHEPIVMARKPLSEKSVADNVIEWGTGGINIDDSRISTSDTDPNHRHNPSQGNNGKNSIFGVGGHTGNLKIEGRFPANVIFDEEAGKVLDEQSGHLKSGFMKAGTALKPAHEPIVMARKPLSEKTVADNVLEWGTGGINIDECRIGSDGGTKRSHQGEYPKNEDGSEDRTNWVRTGHDVVELNEGRFPANVIFDEEAGKVLDEKNEGVSRFFYCPKTSKAERNEGTDNNHPTVKPTELMTYLIRLVTPKGGITLDPFMGSGSTGKAAIMGGFDFVGIEREEEYFQIAEGRINYQINKPTKTTKSKVSKGVEEKVNQFFG